MLVVQARNVSQMLPKAMRHLRDCGVRQPSRNGDVLRAPFPVTSVYERPEERVELFEARDSNPFFHLMESLWMLGGRDDVQWLRQFNSNISRYSDDGQVFHGAYGHRWRVRFGMDQLETIVHGLRENPTDRRMVLQMWDSRLDLGRPGLDFPCNLSAIFGISPDGKLDMMVSNRSNDVIWGCYGANAVHFSVLQEFVARSVGVPVGRYHQVSFNWHLYLEPHEQLLKHLAEIEPPDHYADLDLKPYPLMSTPPETWLGDLDMFLREGESAVGYHDKFFRRVAVPMLRAWKAFKEQGDADRFVLAQSRVSEIAASDWQLACRRWINRRYTKWTERQSRT